MPTPCGPECSATLDHFGEVQAHVSDLGDRISLVSFAEAESLEVARKAHAHATAAWRLLSGPPDALSPIWAHFAHSWDIKMQSLTERRIEFLARPTLAVVDQNGSVRGLWPADDEGRGQAINAARMFARYGTEP